MRSGQSVASKSKPARPPARSTATTPVPGDSGAGEIESLENPPVGLMGIGLNRPLPSNLPASAPATSIDYNNDPRSSIVDAPSTMVTDGTLLKVYSWYDNEVGYACRMVDLANIVLQAGV